MSAPEPVAVPEPGRHASRRRRGGWQDRVPVSGVHVAVLALVVGVALAVTAWLVLAGRARPEPLPRMAPVATSLVPTSPEATGSGTTSGATAGATAGPGAAASPAAGVDLVVDVAGKVRRPGIVELPPGSRVADALEAAGGPRPGVSLTSLNLARLPVDGEQILVGVPAPQALGATASSQGAGAAGPLVNLNTADLATLETLPGVGPVTAQAILDWRTEHGGFTAVEELLEVDGIGDATLADLAPHVTV